MTATSLDDLGPVDYLVVETQDSFTASHSQKPCCAPPSDERVPRRIIKGGSHLCAPNYCLRFRPAARQGEAVDTSTSHIGFRCILRSA